MARRKVATTVYLDTVQIDALRALSAASDVPVAALVRRALTAYLSAQQAPQR